MTRGKATKEQTIQSPQEKLQKDRQYNDQRKSYKRTDNTMITGKATTFVAFPLVIVLSVLL
jgi:hypothetical protein